MTSNQLVTCLRADRRRPGYSLWLRWMEEAASLADRFWQEEGDDPFWYGEQASLGFLATADSRAGFLALPKFAIDKRAASDRRRKVHGRADLWLAMNRRSWWFEAKQHFATRGSDRDLERKWAAAKQCADQTRHQGTAVAMLIVSCYRIHADRKNKALKALKTIERFRSNRNFLFSLDAATVSHKPTYFSRLLPH